MAFHASIDNMAIKKKSRAQPSSNGHRPRSGASKSKAPLLAKARNGALPSRATPAGSDLRTYSIPDLRLEHPDLSVRQHAEKDKNGVEHVRYEVSGDLQAPVPPIRDSKYLSKQQCIEIYRFMLLNRKMEVALENLYKQGKVVGGVYFGLATRAHSLSEASAPPIR